MALVFWDQYSRYPVVEFVTSTSAEAFIPQLTRVFTTYGIPEKVKKDNGPPFNGSRFAKYAQEQGFRHRKVTLGCSEANGDVERFMQTVKKSPRVAKIEGKAFRQEVQRTVGNYRSTPHPVTRESPDKLMFGREIRRKLPERVVPQEGKRHDPIRVRDEGKKKQMKAHADKRRHAQQSLIQIGDRVLLKQNEGNTLTPAHDPRPYAVVGVKGSMITVMTGKEIKSRNSPNARYSSTLESRIMMFWIRTRNDNQ